MYHWLDETYRNQILENMFEILNTAIVKRVDGFLASKLPASLPQDLDRALVRVDSVELLAKDPAHFESDEYSLFCTEYDHTGDT